MHPQTYDIREFQTKEQAVEYGYSVDLTKEAAAKLSSMNRQQRRAWLAQQRKAGKR
jgi:hypothetical protein